MSPEKKIHRRHRRAEIPTVPACPTFAASVDRAGESVAVLGVAGAEAVTYGELDRRAGRLAERLRLLGVGPESIVGLYLERSVAMAVGILGVARAGAAYLPLDPGDPAARVAFMIEDAEPSAIVTDKRLADGLNGYRGALVCAGSTRGGQIRSAPAPPFKKGGLGGISPPPTPDNAAYVLYTSGSTGRPKGTVIPRRALANYLRWMAAALPLRAGDRVLQGTPVTFDPSVWEFWATWTAGACLVFGAPSERRTASGVAETLRRERITVLQVVPSFFADLVDEPAFGGAAGLRRVVSGGEPLPPALRDRFFARGLAAELVNAYGPTEATIHAAWALCREADERVPIGHPILNTRVHVLDHGLFPVEPGAGGALYLAGLGLARGYLGRPGLTAEKFLPDPFAGPGGRLYDTGDRARRLADGALELLGRADGQVKINGARVEPGEVEALLAEHPDVERSAVVARPAPGSGSLRLAAYVVARRPVSASDLRARLRRRLPGFMVPAAFVFLDALPRAASGKLDRRALPSPWRRRPYAAPGTARERELAELWQEVLGVERIGLDEPFTELGGDSILGARLINRLQERLGETIYVAALFEAPTVRELARYLEEHYLEEHYADARETDGGAEGAEARVDRADADRLRKLLSRRRSRRAGAEAPLARPAVFVLSPPRSGSTLLRVMLGGHPGLFAPPELELLAYDTLAERREACGGRLSFLLEGTVRAIMELEGRPAGTARRIMASYEDRGLTVRQLYALLQERVGGRVLVDKSTTYAEDLEVLRRAETLFENAFYVHLVRHPCGVIHSFCEARMDRIFRCESPFSPRRLAELLWLTCHENIVRFLAEVPAERRHRVDFEDLVERPEAVTADLCRFLGLEPDPAVADPYRRLEGRMADGLHPESRPVGDSKVLGHGRLAPEAARRWRGRLRPESLGDPTRRLARELGLDVPLPLAPVPAALAAADGSGRHPLSFAQERMWILGQLAPASADYNMAAAWRLAGVLHGAALEESFGRLVERHAALRTAFPAGGGRPVQLVAPAGPFVLPLVDLEALPAARRRGEARRRIAAEASRPFDLERGPLFRTSLWRLAGREHVLAVAVHHITADGGSIDVLVRDLGALYRGGACPLPALPIRYADFAVWQREALDGEASADLLAYWRRRLDGLAALRLPADRPRGAARDAVLFARLPRPRRAAGATLHMTWLALFAALLHRLSGQNDLAIGAPVSQRDRRQLEGLVGCFVNMLVTRVAASGRLPFRELLAEVRKTALEAYAHRDLPFERLVEELRPARAPDRHPLFQVSLDLRKRAALELPGVRTEAVEVETGKARFDLEVFIEEVRGEKDCLGVFLYRADLFDAATVARWAEHLGTLAREIAAHPERPLSRLALLAPAERHQLLVEENDTRAPYARSKCLHELFAARAGLAPDAVAVVSATDAHQSYRELDRRSDRLARELAALGAGPEARVAVSLERSPELVAALWAVTKAGAAYVPVDPSWPAERNELVLADCGAVLTLGRRGPEAARGTADRGSRRRARPRNLAYVLYTSGSTGRPKGVMVEHRALVHHTASAIAGYRIEPDDRVLQFASASFDASAEEIFPTLVRGAALVLRAAAAAAAPDELLEQVERQRVTVLDLPTTFWHELVAALEDGRARLPRSLRLVIVGGEQVSGSRLEGWHRAARATTAHREVRLVNGYGPTEATIVATRSDLTRPLRGAGALEAPPIGRPISNAAVHVAGPFLELAPLGVSGEVLIGGAGVARGYLADPRRTAEKFVPDPFGGGAGARLYRSGDVARRSPERGLVFLGRLDRQVKVRGFRVEPGEVEAHLLRHPAVREAAVTAERAAGTDGGEARLIAYVALRDGAPASASALRGFLRRRLPEPMVPAGIVLLEALPRTPAGKLDRGTLPLWNGARTDPPRSPPRSETERRIARIWADLLGLEDVGADESFFDLGGHSMLVVRVRDRLREELGRDLPIAELFRHPTVGALARRVGEDFAGGPGEGPGRSGGRTASAAGGGAGGARDSDVAIIGIAGRFPGASEPGRANLAEFWRRLRDGVESISTFSAEELERAGVAPELLAHPRYVRARGVLEDIDLFDAELFGLAAREAALMDPQHRLFLECAWEALEAAGYDPRRFAGRIGLFAGAGLHDEALARLVRSRTDGGSLQVALLNEKDFLPARVSYVLDLKGPSVNVQTACSTSLVAVHMACRSLVSGECDLALAGGVSLAVPHRVGYLHDGGHVFSPDGRCRAFDARGRGFVPGHGAGVVVLKPAGRALADGDAVHALVKGSAVTNDGAARVGFTAPGVDGQAAAVAEALALAGAAPETLGYVEAHGTATPLGDPVEIAALTRAFGGGAAKRGSCAVGSVKTNLGHLGEAAGIAGLIKTVLALEHREIPPTLHFEEPNPEIDFDGGPFFVNAEPRPWPAVGGPRRAGVSSLGLGGTNAHAVLEEAPPAEPSGPSRPRQLLVLSAATETALDRASSALADHLERRPETALPDAAYTLAVGRRELRHRRVLVAAGSADAVRVLRGHHPERLRAASARSRRPPLVFLFPGGGSQTAGMGRELYVREPEFRRAIDRTSELFRPHLGLDLRGVLYGRDSGSDGPPTRPALALPALFATEVALARLWTSWGARPDALIGHSLGEYVAAHLSGVLTLEDAVRLVALRGELFERLPAGAMLSVPLPEDEVVPRLGRELSLAAVNARDQCVVSGPREAIAAFAAALGRRGAESHVLAIDVAAHSRLVESVLAELAEAVRGLRTGTPRIPYVSNVTGDWITEDETADPDYWVRHLRSTVRFADGLARILADGDPVLLEAGPGRTLAALARRNGGRPTVLTSLPHPDEGSSDLAWALTTLGRLWLAGTPVDWDAFYRGQRRHRIELPTYPFERRRIEPEPAAPLRPASPAPGVRTYLPGWRRGRPASLSARTGPDHGTWLVFTPEPVGPGNPPPGLLLSQRRGRPTASLPVPPFEKGGLGGISRQTKSAGKGIERLAGEGRTLVTVAPGESFSRTADDGYVLRPASRADYGALWAHLGQRGLLPDRVVHLWSLESDALEMGFLSLLNLAQARAEYDDRRPWRLDVVSSGLWEVTGGERIWPEKSTLLGLARVLPQEHPEVTCRVIDVDSRYALGDELLSGAPDPEVALRRRHRWIPTFEAAALEAGRGRARLRRGGVYLITGGLGGLGLEIAEHLATELGAKLVLVGRSGSDETARLRAVREAGGEVLVAGADVSRADEMRAVLERARSRFGRLHGVIHAAGVGGGGLLRLKTAADVAEVFAAKVEGTRVLEALLREEEPVDFFLLCSSLSALLGGVGNAAYAAANAFLDAFAHANSLPEETLTVAVDWDVWRGVGLAEDPKRRASREFWRRGPEDGLTPREGLEIFRQALGAGVPQVIVSTEDLETRIAAGRSFDLARELASLEPEPRGAHRRPTLETPYVPPEGDLERRIAEVWQELLGLDRVGIHDSFLELGGHSLLATQALVRLRGLGVDLDLREFFHAGTVAGIARTAGVSLREKTESAAAVFDGFEDGVL